MNLKQIDGYEDYSVSDDGRVFSMKFGKVKELKIWKDSTDRSLVCLWKDSIKKNFLVSRLVINAFYGPGLKDQVCCHNDGDHNNNNITNLRWDYQKDNIHDKFSHRTILRGEAVGNSVLNKHQVLQIRAAYAIGNTSHGKLAKQYKVSRALICKIVNRKVWTHI